MKTPANPAPRVVVVGGGFAGMAATRALARSGARVTLVDRRNHHLFQPLLYQVATAALSPGDIAWPIRAMLRGQANVRVLLSRVVGVDMAAQCVKLEDDEIPFDHLVLATGARHAYFGRDEWEERAPGLKKILDATHIREKLLMAFERAEALDDPVATKRLLTFVVIGGGPTGVEMAGAIAELAQHTLARDFRIIDPASARVVLIQAGARLLETFPERLSENARRELVELGVEVRLGERVNALTDDGVQVGDEDIPSANVVWAAGVMASPAGKWLGAAVDRAGRVIVEPDLSVPGHPNVFVIGDTASAVRANGEPVPGIAPAAKQMGTHVGRTLAARIVGGREPGAFRYRHLGNLATIGRTAAVADFGWIKMTGHIAWVLWAIVHVFFLIGWRNRLVVALSWFWSYVTYGRGVRLVTAGEEVAREIETHGAHAGGRAA
ncbi:MAG: NAD(P)/FAD-dependent oxidoreductase [Pseudomonadota bacterium]